MPVTMMRPPSPEKRAAKAKEDSLRDLKEKAMVAHAQTQRVNAAAEAVQKSARLMTSSALKNQTRAQQVASAAEEAARAKEAARRVAASCAAADDDVARADVKSWEPVSQETQRESSESRSAH